MKAPNRKKIHTQKSRVVVSSMFLESKFAYDFLFRIFSFASTDDLYLNLVFVNKFFRDVIYCEKFTTNVLLERMGNRSKSDMENNTHHSYNSLLSIFNLKNSKDDNKERLRRCKYLRKFLFGGFSVKYLNGGVSAVKSFELKNIRSSVNMKVGATEFVRIDATLTCNLSKCFGSGDVMSFHFEIVLYASDIYTFIPKSTRNRRLSQKLEVGEDYYKFKKVGELEWIKFGADDAIDLFSKAGMELMIGKNKVSLLYDFTKFCQKVRAKKRQQKVVASIDLVMDVFLNRQHDDPGLTKALTHYAKLGAMIEKKSEECLMKTEMSSPRLIEMIFDIGLKVVNSCNKNMRHFVEKNKNRYLDSNSMPFLVTNKEKGGKKTILVENLEVENIEFEEELREFDKYAEDNYPSRFNKEFLDSDYNFVMDHEIDKCFKNFPSLSKLISCFIRSDEENEKYMRVLGIVSVIYSSVRKQNKYFAKYYHPIFISFNFEDPAFKFFNKFFGICYSKKSNKTVQKIATVRIDESKCLGETDALILTQDNITKTNYHSVEKGQFHLTSTSYFIGKLNFQFNGYFQKERIEYLEIEGLYLKRDDLTQIIQNSQNEILDYVTKKKRLVREFVTELASNTLEVLNLKPIIVECFSNKEITRSVKNVFEDNFEEIENVNNFKCHISDLGYYVHASRILKLTALKFPGWFHVEMALAELCWVYGRRNQYMELVCDKELNFKCSYLFKGSKYQRYREAIISSSNATQLLMNKYNLTYEELENGKYNNQKIKNLMCVHFLEMIYMYVMYLIQNNEYEKLVQMLPLLKDLFSLSGKTHYKNAMFETMIVHKLLKPEVFEFITFNRLVSVQHKDKYFPVDKLGEVMIHYQKMIKVNMQGIESWSEMAPVYSYFMYNYRNEISSFLKSKKNLEDKDVSMEKWRIEKNVDYIFDVLDQAINPSMLNRDTLVVSGGGVSGIGLLGGQSLLQKNPCTLYRKLRYLLAGRNEAVRDRKEWDKKKIDLWNQNGTIYTERDEVTEEEIDDGIDDNISEWSETESLRQKEDDSGFYVPPNFDDDENDHLISED